MSDFPLGVRITLFGGVFAVLGLVWTQSQRLGEVRSIFLSRVLGVLGLFGSVAWIEFGLWLFWKINLFDDYPWIFWAIAIVTGVAVAWWAKRNGWFVAARNGEDEQKVTMLFSKMWEESAWREDLKGNYILEICLRNDYSKPVGAEFVKWVESGARSGQTLPITNFIKLRGLRYPKGHPPYSIDEQRGVGPSKMVVNAGEAFRVTVEVYQTFIPEIGIDKISDDHPIGILILLVEGQELQFPIVYRNVKRQAPSWYETWRRSQR